MKKGEIKIFKIDDLAHGGDGVARAENGMAVFISLTLPGDLVKAKITKIKKDYAFAKLIKVIEAGSGRIEAPCPVYNECGGCQLQHIDYQKELEFKHNNIKQLINRIAGIEKFELKDVLAADDDFRYRNKAQFPLKLDENDQITAGFYKRGSHDIVPNHDCLIQHPLINRILRVTLEELNKFQLSVYNENNLRGLLRHLVIRVGTCTNQGLLVMVTNGDDFIDKNLIAKTLMRKIPELKGVVQNINNEDTNVIFGKEDILLAGENKITEYIGQTAYLISARSFFQVNTMQAKKLYDTAAKYLGNDRSAKVIDAFSGTGSIALYLADKAEKIYAVESLESAVKDAEKNAKLNNINNVEFKEGLVEEELSELLEKEEIDSIIFDPPRKGLDEKTVDLLLASSIKKIIYISCNPATQARDLKKLKEKYNLVKIQPVDLFPQTYHIESVALLELNN
ncbi:RNA methyltransferase, TrmA family [Halanaerobium saccharolyticum subsp. saccharolyticum DSM 6643]|uniref:RNA methyltransferase, TrmA family n=1 Tax=Halanaerobium saccharolyticum subsp. saccharolyticum DSM 6643 TaxID=1293054 RepID=M5DXH3_9FIRM|nr:23S rRNA (uracil(1939)-C(5))-methyltransferase RlmD [Halanaerobium saccharolyticum]CCU77809.1 RNA methyltransferase, TrmA family [Halanaerobium saccharolyticum subsp. saccharolyticum DSM 6643]